MNKWLMFFKDFPFFLSQGFKFKRRGFAFNKYIKFIMDGTRNHRIVMYEGKFLIYSFLPFLPSFQFKRAFINLIENFYFGSTPKPYLAMLSITSKCPFDCFYCSSKAFHDGELTRKEVIEILRKLKKIQITMISLTGGEPLLVDYLPGVIKQFSKDFIFQILTSGYGLDEHYARDLKKAGLFGFGFSLDTFNSEEFNRIRGGKSAFDKALEAIEISKRAGIYTMVNSVITKDKANFEFLDKFLKFLKSLDVDEVRLLEPLPCGNLTHHPVEILDAKYLKILIEIQKIACRDRRYPKVTSLPYIESLWGCGAGNQHIYIDPLGFLHPCNFYASPMGNILRDGYDKIMQNLNKLGKFKKNSLCKEKRRIYEKKLYIRDRSLCSSKGNKVRKN